MTIEFKAWGKTPRLFRDIVITEKIDGTNSAVIIQEVQPDEDVPYQEVTLIERDGKWYEVGAQSRNRLITPGKTTDNYGFAAFVQKNAEALVEALGVGHHFGEWWGEGIGRRYDEYRGMRAFSLFNVDRYRDVELHLDDESGRSVLVKPVPVLFEGEFSEDAIRHAAGELLTNGSVAAPFAPNPEGIMIYHTQSKQVYKFTFNNNDKGKWETL